mgnify:CR=1 FL=1
MQQPDRSTRPSFKTTQKLSYIEPRQWTLNNGAQVHFLEGGEEGLVRLDFLFPAGHAFGDSVLEVELTNSLMKEGTRSFSSAEIADKLDYYGADLSNGVNKDKGLLSLITLEKHLPRVLPVLQEIIREPVFSEQEFEIKKTIRKRRFNIDRQKVKILARDRFTEVLFGDHPYGLTMNEEEFDTLTAEGLRSFYKHHYIPSQSQIIMSGQVAGQSLQEVDAFLGNSRGEEPKTDFSEAKPFHSHAEKQHRMQKDGALQTAIRMGRVLFNKNHPDFMKMQVLSTILGGYFGARLMSNLREDKGYTYGIGSALVSFNQTGVFLIVSEVGNGVKEAALKEIRYEIERLQKEPVPGHELTIVKNYMTGSLLKNFDGPFAHAETLHGLVDYGLDFSYFEDYLMTIQNITQEEIMELANKYLRLDDLYEVVAGDFKQGE